MTTQFFVQCNTVESAKIEYVRLAELSSVDPVAMMEIERQYIVALTQMDGQISKDEESGKEYIYKFDEDKEIGIARKIVETLKSGIIGEGVRLYLVGRWIWIAGNTFPIKEQLKTLGYQFRGNRQMWAFHLDEYKHFGSKKGFVSLAVKYGATQFTSEGAQKVA